MLQVTNITCWGMTDAVGVPTGRCQISWKLEADKEGTQQSACQVQILDYNKQPLYDSGKVNTQENRNFMVENLILDESESYLVQVRAWDEQNIASDWGTPCRFITGLKLEHAVFPFIYADDGEINPQTDTVWFRRDFIVDCPIRLAVLHVGSIGYHELYINGIKAGRRLLSPVRSQLTKEKQRVNLVTYDITELLRMGKNVIGLWTDAGWARCDKIAPAFFCRLSVKGEGEDHILYSDEKWRCVKAPITHIGGFGWSDFGGEKVVGRWNDRAWCTAAPDGDMVETKSVKKVDIAPTMELELTDGDGIISEITPLSITNDNGKALIDMGANYTGWLDICFHGGKKGDRITIQAADKSGEAVSFQQISEYVMTESEGRFCNKFNYFSGRYFTISGLRMPLKREDIKGYRIGSLLERKDEFLSSSTLLNQIYQADIDTFTAATLNGISVDCPHRERLGYGETGISTTWGIGLQAFETQAFYRNYFRNWRESQETSGYFPHVTPNSSGGGGTAWSSCLTISLYDTFCYTADLSLLREDLEAVQKWADFLIAYTQNGILQRYPEDANDWGFLGDWATPEGDDWGNSENALFFNNCVAVYTLMLTAKIADILGENEMAVKYRAHCNMMRRAIHQKFYRGQEEGYLQGEQRYLAAALCAGIAPETEKKNILQAFVASLQRKGYLDSGSAGTVFVFRAALENGLQDQICRILQRTEYPGYGYFIAQGQNTWPEMWDMRDVYGGSRIHTCYTGVAGFIIRALTGIEPLKYGMREMKIAPYFPRMLDYLTTGYDYGYGKVRTSWHRENKRILYQIELPTNTTARLFLPGHSSVLLSGKYTFIVDDKDNMNDSNE